MMRALRYGLIGLVAFVIGLVAFLPARVAAGWAEQMGPISMGGVSGTLFDGRASYISGPDGAIENVSWQLEPASLLLARISARLQIDSDLSGFDADVSRSLFGQTTIRNVSGSASAGWLAKLGGYTFLPLSGDVRVNIDEAVFDDELQFDALAGQISLVNTRWQLFNPPVPLGRFTAALAQSEQGLRATVVESDGPLAIDGGLTLDATRRYLLDVRLRARAGADERLPQMLDQLGRADADGWHPIREQGRL
ncbi:type II secretion system protein N [Salinisphaera sp.]|uniref:type II secretion system protein N n=1 Tax=Salinisphaera sp. TaxID=1914330 RepID=UPI000C5A2C9B|nr:type II secretion system protein N [Salinisphaera sp.]MBS63495.1 type II secretion system protein N [Salinisphaera sp.]